MPSVPSVILFSHIHICPPEIKISSFDNHCLHLLPIFQPPTTSLVSIHPELFDNINMASTTTSNQSLRQVFPSLPSAFLVDSETDINCRRPGTTTTTQAASNAVPNPIICPYHGPILAMMQNVGGKNLSPMERFLGEGASEQSAMFTRPDNGKLSIERGCLCAMSKRD